MRAEAGLLRLDPEIERRTLLSALDQAGGNQKRAAAILGISRCTLMKRMDDHQLPRPRKRPTVD